MPALRDCCARLLPALALALSLAVYAYAQRAPVPPPTAPQGNCTHHDDATRPDCPAAIAFLAKFQDALKSNDKSAVASLIHYPLLVVTAGGKRRIARAELLANFDHTFNPTLRVAVLSATPDDVWGNANGFMVARGAIWFDAVIPRNAPTDEKSLAKYPMKLITINPVYP
jgi:hypothetical protein